MAAFQRTGEEVIRQLTAEAAQITEAVVNALPPNLSGPLLEELAQGLTDPKRAMYLLSETKNGGDSVIRAALSKGSTGPAQALWKAALQMGHEGMDIAERLGEEINRCGSKCSPVDLVEACAKNLTRVDQVPQFMALFNAAGRPDRPRCASCSMPGGHWRLPTRFGRTALPEISRIWRGCARCHFEWCLNSKGPPTTSSLRRPVSCATVSRRRTGMVRCPDRTNARCF